MANLPVRWRRSTVLRRFRNALRDDLPALIAETNTDLAADPDASYLLADMRLEPASGLRDVVAALQGPVIGEEYPTPSIRLVYEPSSVALSGASGTYNTELNFSVHVMFYDTDLGSTGSGADIDAEDTVTQAMADYQSAIERLCLQQSTLLGGAGVLEIQTASSETELHYVDNQDVSIAARGVVFVTVNTRSGL